MNTLRSNVHVSSFYLIANRGWYKNDNVGQRRIILKFQYYNLKKIEKKRGKAINKTHPLACQFPDVHLLYPFLCNTIACSMLQTEQILLPRHNPTKQLSLL